MAILLQNKLLEAAEQKIESSLTPETRPNYLRIVVAGMKAAAEGGPQSIIASLKASKNPIHDAVVGAINLVLMMSRQSRGTMPVKALVPAAMTLMLHALDFAERIGLVKIGNTELVQATHLFTNALFQRLKITPTMLHGAIRNVHGITQDPAKMELINRQLGAAKHPDAKDMGPIPSSAPVIGEP